MEAEREINLTVVDDLRHIIRNHQLRLMAEPDPDNPWWFLVAPWAEFKE